VTDAREPGAAIGDVAGAIVAGPGAMELAAIWATVDLERTLRDLGEETRDALGDAAASDAHLGARVLFVPARAGHPALAIAEPATEGRLAATLARHGEGLVGRYLAVADGLDQARARAYGTGVAVSRVEIGPFGPSVLVLIGPVTGPHLILCEPAAVPSGS
jgi:hypothetical protein